MPVADLSYVTKTYIELIRRGVALFWPSATLPKVLPMPPGDLNVDGIGLYMYHAIQLREHDSFPIPSPEPEARLLPMALNLYYQLTAHSVLEDENGVYNEQLMMAIAMKALHDCPIIVDTTLTPGNPNPVMDFNIRGKDNRLKISQQPIPYTEAVHNWTAGQAPMKLSAYYEVSIVFLEPDELTSYSGRVLLYGNYVFLKGAPRITSSQNIIPYKVPGDPVSREVRVQPAQAPPSPNPPTPTLNASIINFYGEGFEGGTISVRILHPRFTEEVVAGPDWDIAVPGPGNVAMTVRETASLASDGSSIDILPGIYSAQLIVRKTLQLPNGLSKEFSNTSNQFPFIITPRISVGAFAGSTVPVTGYVFQYFVGAIDILIDDIEVYAGETKMIRTAAAIINPGEFEVMTASLMQINVPGTLNPGMNIPIRIVISGAESGPAWATV